MYLSIETGLNPFVESIVQAMQPVAHTRNVKLLFAGSGSKCFVSYQPEVIGNTLLTLLCRAFNYIPSNTNIQVSLTEEPVQVTLVVQISGINLRNILEITRALPLTPGVTGKDDTYYQFTLPKESRDARDIVALPIANTTAKPNVPAFYAAIRKRLQSRNSNADKLVSLTSIHNPADAAFLQKINDIIFANISDGLFDAGKLADKVYLSRAHLFRRLKTITGKAPAEYIKSLRLQQAKKLLETTDIRVSEAAYATGFESASHFAKSFSKRYGFAPSLLKRKPHATNEQEDAT